MVKFDVNERDPYLSDILESIKQDVAEIIMMNTETHNPIVEIYEDYE